MPPRTSRQLKQMLASMLAISLMAAVQAAPPANPSETRQSATTTPTKFGPQVEIESKFVEIVEGTVLSVGGSELPIENLSGIFTDPQFQVVIRGLNQKKGVDLLSAPRVITRSKQQAMIEIIREFQNPSDWQRDTGGAWKPKESESKKVGVTLKVRPEIQADGTIELWLKPTVVEFLGFVDLDAGEAGIKTPSLPKDLEGQLDVAATRSGKRLKPIFSERTKDAVVKLKDGYTVALTGFDEKSGDTQPRSGMPARKLIVFVSARSSTLQGLSHRKLRKNNRSGIAYDGLRLETCAADH